MSGAGGPSRRPAWPPSRRSSGRPATTRCCATPCWRTCTAPSSTRWRRPRRTGSCSTTSAAPTTSSPGGSVAAGRRSATPCGCSTCPRPSSAGWPRACSAPATPGPCSASPTPSAQDRLAGRVVSEGISVRGLEELVAVGEHGEDDDQPRVRSARPTAPGLLGAGRPAQRPARHPGQGGPGPLQGPDQHRVRLAERPGADRRRDRPAQPGRQADLATSRQIALSTKRQERLGVPAARAARRRARSAFSSASSSAARSGVGAVPPREAGSHQEPGGCSSAG